MGLKTTTNENKKQAKPFYRKWWFWVIIVVILSAIFGNSGDKTNNTQTETTQKVEQKNEEKKSLATSIDGGCRALTKRFIQGAVGEDYSALAYNVEDFEIDENENGTIKVLYLPSNAGEKGATKVNLTITLNNGLYKIDYAMLSCLYEVDLSQVSKEHKELNTN